MKRIFAILLCSIFYSAFAQQNINMPLGVNTASYTTCNANFYDAGGAAGNHGLNQASSVTFTPSTIGLAVKIQFVSFAVGVGASMAIYDGPDNTHPIIGIYDQFYNPTGLSIVASPTNVNGSIYVQFTSGSNNGVGWVAKVTCRAPCQTYNVQIDPLVTTKPIVEEIYMNVCRDSCVTFGAEAVFLQNNINYSQTQSNTMFIWKFGHSIMDTAQVTIQCFDQVRGYDYSLYAIDTMGCYPNTMFKGRIRVADNPIRGTPPLPDACSGGSYSVYVGNDPQATITVTTVGANQTGTLSEAQTVFLPDGNGLCHNSDIVFDIFNPGQLLTNVNHLIGVNVVMEHSFLGDLSIRLQCPSGASAILKAFNAGNPMPTGPISNPCSVGGGGIDLGCAPNPSGANACYASPGIGWEYEFRPTSSVCFGAGGATVGYNFTDPCGQIWTGPALIPTVPNTYTNSVTYQQFYGPYESFGNLLNCPLNGNWRLTVCDNYPYDNGYVFSWSLTLDQSIVPEGWYYNVNIDTVIWHGANVTATSPTSAIINMGQAGDFVYNVTIIDEYGCEYDTSFTLLVIQSPEPNINNGIDTAKLCPGEIIILNANYVDTAAVYWWNTGAYADEIMALAEGLYFIEVTASTEDGSLVCTGRDSIYVSINPHPFPDFDIDKKDACAPVKVQFSNLTSPLVMPMTYSWKIFNIIGQEVFNSNQVDPNFFIETPGVYHVQLISTTVNGCTDSIMKWNFFEVHPQPIAEFSFNPEISLLSESGGVINFTNYCDSAMFASNPDASWYWDFDDGSRDSTQWNASHTFSTWGDYNVGFYITTAFGCKSSIIHTVIIEEDLEFPNIITPNGDGLNDVFAIKNLNVDINPEDPDQYRANSLQIYDRWGKKVYDEENYDTYMKDEQIYPGNKVFDGTKLQDGQYYFSFNYKGKVKYVKYSGSLLIIRNN